MPDPEETAPSRACFELTPREMGQVLVRQRETIDYLCRILKDISDRLQLYHIQRLEGIAREIEEAMSRAKP